MRTRWIQLWDFLRSSYWFLPLCMSCMAVLLAEIMLLIDAAVPDQVLEQSRFVYAADAEGQRTLLLTIGTTTLGTAGVVFSLTTVPLSVAAAQFGSRLLRNYLRNTMTQAVLGAYFGTFLYCMVVLFSLPLNNETLTSLRGLPHLATTVSIAMALLTFCSLLLFIHNVGISLQAPVVIDDVGDEIEKTIVYYESVLGDAPPIAKKDEEALRKLAQRVRAEGISLVERETGYVEAIDIDQLMSLAQRYDVVLYLLAHPGDFVGTGSSVALLWPAETTNRSEIADAVRSAYMIGKKRTLTQDIEFGINSLVEIAVRAMSPAINDPFTAMNCLDRLGVVLSRIIITCRPWSYRFDDTGSLRLIYDPVTFSRLTDASFHLIRQYSRGNAEVLIRMLDTLLAILQHMPVLGPDAAEDRDALRRHADLVAGELEGGGLPNAYDRERIRTRYNEVIAALEQVPRTDPQKRARHV